MFLLPQFRYSEGLAVDLLELGALRRATVQSPRFRLNQPPGEPELSSELKLEGRMPGGYGLYTSECWSLLVSCAPRFTEIITLVDDQKTPRRPLQIRSAARSSSFPDAPSPLSRLMWRAAPGYAPHSRAPVKVWTVSPTAMVCGFSAPLAVSGCRARFPDGLPANSRYKNPLLRPGTAGWK